MREWQSLAHVKWECKYHVVIVPKYRKKVLFGRLRGEVGKIIRQLCRQKEVELIEGHAMPDHIHLVLSIPPKYSIAMVIGYPILPRGAQRGPLQIWSTRDIQH